MDSLHNALPSTNVKAATRTPNENIITDQNWLLVSYY